MNTAQFLKEFLKKNWKDILILLLGSILFCIIIISMISGIKEKYEKTIEPKNNWGYLPHLEDDDIKIFRKYLEKGNRCFEFGCGYSTLYIAKIPNIEKVISIENNIEWFEKIEQKIEDEKMGDIIQLKYIDTDSDHSSWGFPKSKNLKKFRNYYTSYDIEFKADTIFIDGRFRISCALDILDKIDTTIWVIIDDFSNRPEYHVLLKYYEKEECGKILVVLKKKSLLNKDELEKDKEFYKLDER